MFAASPHCELTHSEVICLPSPEMQVSAGQDGIQRLLAAEQEAQKIVAKARKGIGRLSAGLDLSFGIIGLSCVQA